MLNGICLRIISIAPNVSTAIAAAAAATTVVVCTLREFTKLILFDGGGRGHKENISNQMDVFAQSLLNYGYQYQQHRERRR